MTAAGSLILDARSWILDPNSGDALAFVLFSTSVVSDAVSFLQGEPGLGSGRRLIFKRGFPAELLHIERTKLTR
jgi:hypothetical protein